MNIKEILANFDENRLSHVATEAIILDLLELHVKAQKKDFQLHQTIYNYTTSTFLRVDGYAPEGFDEFFGKTLVEIKLYKNASTLERNLGKIINLFANVSSDKLDGKQIFSNLLIITSCTLPPKLKKKLENKYKNIFPLKYYIWDNSQLQTLFNKYPEFVAELDFNPKKPLLKQAVNDGLNPSISKWEVKRDEHLQNLKERFNNDDVVLFLGAGISLDAGIPTWNDLMSNLMVTLIDTVMSDKKTVGHLDLSEGEKRALVKAIQKRNGNSPLQLVRFIRNGLGELFRDELTKILYKNCKNKSRILEAITDLSVPLRHGIGLQGVVTYNFDDLLERNYTSKKVIKYHSIYKEADIASKNELGIYHVHGFLPQNPYEFDGLKDNKNKAKNLLVFSEEEYHQLMLEPFHWSNLVQLNYFRERTCLFIGMSMTDPNVRRLLEIARQKQPDQDECKHYIILKRDSFEDISDEGQDINTDDVNKENIMKFSMVHQNLKEVELRELGLNVIWVDEHDEIPDLLDKLRQ